MSDDLQFQITPERHQHHPEITPTVVIGSDYVLPKRFLASVDLGDLAVTLDVELDESASPTCHGLSLRPVGEGSLDSGSLRAVAIHSLLRQATAAAAQKIEPAAEQVFIREEGTGERHRFHPLTGPGSELDTVRPATATERRAFYEQIAGARGPGRGSAVTDDHLSRVAAVYRTAVEQGDPPTQTVADAMYAARSTAGRWVVEARKRGFLGPATKGRAGERKETQS
ncbi:MAG: hypothetical protein ACRDLL_12035 [Solirubrobacterales bacterium]